MEATEQHKSPHKDSNELHEQQHCDESVIYILTEHDDL